jgi:cob(I)alamin adenosyltransferase
MMKIYTKKGDKGTTGLMAELEYQKNQTVLIHTEQLMNSILLLVWFVI